MWFRFDFSNFHNEPSFCVWLCINAVNKFSTNYRQDAACISFGWQIHLHPCLSASGLIWLTVMLQENPPFFFSHPLLSPLSLSFPSSTFPPFLVWGIETLGTADARQAFHHGTTAPGPARRASIWLLWALSAQVVKSTHHQIFFPHPLFWLLPDREHGFVKLGIFWHEEHTCSHERFSHVLPLMNYSIRCSPLCTGYKFSFSVFCQKEESLASFFSLIFPFVG